MGDFNDTRTTRTTGRRAASRHGLSRTPVALAVAGCLCLGMVPAFAAPTVFNDSYTLSTSNQSMWASGGQSGWSYNSGFQGSSWGPTSNGVNAITGSSNAVIIPGTPEVCVWGGACIPGIPEVRGDTRTGAAVSVTSSGKVGVAVNAQASGGSVSVVLPVATQLVIGDAVGGVFHVGGASTVNGGAKITADAPSFKAGVDGIVNLNNSFTGTGCFIGAGCSSSTSSVNVNPGQFSIVGMDTDATKPISAFGLPTPITKFGNEYVIRAGSACASGNSDQGNVPACNSLPFATPALAVIKPDNLSDFSGGTVNNNVVSVSHNDPVLRLTADLTGILQSALGFPVDVLNPSLNLGIATVSGSLLNVQAGVTLGMTQEFSLDPTMLVTLLFDKPVSEYDPVSKKWIDRGLSVTIDLALGADLRFTNDIGHLIGRTYSVKDEANFSSNTSLSIDPTLPIRAACFDLELKGGLGGTGNQCAFNQEFKTTNLLDIDVYDADYSLGGFNDATYAMTPLDIVDIVAVVPEPSSVLLMVSALMGLGGIAWRRQKRQGGLVAAA